MHKTRKVSEIWRRYAFIGIWIVANVAFGWQLNQGLHSFESPMTLLSLLVLLLCTTSLLWWIPNPIRDESSDETTRTKKGWFVLIIIAAIGILFPLRTLVGPPLLIALPIIAVSTLVLLKQPIARREGMYALGLAVVAGVTGLGAGWISAFTPIEWSILQILLVLTGFLAGWNLLRHTGLLQRGVGRSRFLMEGVPSAIRGFAQGILIGMPWALGIVAMGGSKGESWVKVWWQPIIAIQPGIAEEAWGRILLVPLLFLILRCVSRTRLAFTTALVVIGYWFAYLHTSGGPDAIVSTFIIGTLYALPTSYLCLYRDLETAIGFHFWLDFVKSVFAFISFKG